MADDFTESGIDVLGKVRWGSHFCQFYQRADDLLDILVPYFVAGLEQREFCMWVTAPNVGADDALRALRERLPEVDRLVEAGQIEVIPHDEWYLKDGVFDADRVLQGWVDKLNGALARGYEGLRLTGNTFWLERSDWQTFNSYERTVNEVIGRYRMVALCTYQVDRCGVSEVADVISSHQFALVKRRGRWERIESAERKRSEEERERLLVELSRRAAQLDAANRELESFAYSVSHDLRTPLRGINGFSQALLEDYGDQLNDQARGYLGRIRAGTEQMARLIDALLSLSRATRRELQCESVDLSVLAGAIAAELQRNEPERAVQLSIAPGLMVNGDARLLRVVLENLLANAWKFTAKHPTARIEFGAVQQEGGPTYFVRDDGAGFEMTYVGQLFRPFQRLHTEREFPGTGVGLATVQRVVHRHGGRVWADGAVERGATFYFTLPPDLPRAASQNGGGRG